MGRDTGDPGLNREYVMSNWSVRLRMHRSNPSPRGSWGSIPDMASNVKGDVLMLASAVTTSFRR